VSSVQRFGLVHNQQGYYGSQLTRENAKYISGKLNEESRRIFNTRAQVREVEMFPVDDGQAATIDELMPLEEPEQIIPADEFAYLMEEVL